MKILRKSVIIIFFIMLAVISFVKISDWAISPDIHAHSIETIENNKSTVLKLAAASTAASATVSLLPGDACTPIAEKLSDLSGYFLIVLSALYLEKYLLTIFGYAAFKVLVPIGLIYLGVGLAFGKEKFRAVAGKLVISGLLLFTLIPVSVKVSDIINEAYANSYEQVIEEANDISADNEESGKYGQVVSWLENTSSKAVNYVTTLLSHFIDSLAVLIVTSCLIPIIVFIIIISFIKMIMGSQHLKFS